LTSTPENGTRSFQKSWQGLSKPAPCQGLLMAEAV
jgi:hypothetical protein